VGLAEVQRVEGIAAGGLQLGVAGLHFGRRVKLFGDAGLVGNHDEVVASGFEAGQAFGHAGADDEVVQLPHVVAGFVI